MRYGRAWAIFFQFLVILAAPFVIFSGNGSSISSGSFVDLEYFDAEEDEYKINFVNKTTTEKIEVYGKKGDYPAMDMVSLRCSLVGSDMSIRIEMSSDIVDFNQVYHIFFVRTDHRQTGILLDPENITDSIECSYCDPECILLQIDANPDFPFRGIDTISQPELEGLQGMAEGKVLTITFPKSSIDSMGTLDDNEYGIFVFSEYSATLFTNKETTTFVCWDAIGLGAADSPEEFNLPLQDRPDDKSTLTFISIDYLTLEIKNVETDPGCQIWAAMIDADQDGFVAYYEVDAFEKAWRIRFNNSKWDLDFGVYIDGLGPSIELLGYDIETEGGHIANIHKITVTQRYRLTYSDLDTEINNHTLDLKALGGRFDLRVVPPRGYEISSCRGLEKQDMSGSTLEAVTREMRTPVVYINYTGEGLDFWEPSDNRGDVGILLIIGIISVILLVLTAVVLTFIVKRRKKKDRDFNDLLRYSNTPDYMSSVKGGGINASSSFEAGSTQNMKGQSEQPPEELDPVQAYIKLYGSPPPPNR